MTEQAELWLLRNREGLVVDWERCADQIKELGDQIRAFVDTFIEALRPAFETFAEQLCVFYVGLQRIQLEIVLMRRWHIPNGIAYWFSQKCPERWLPELKPELREWDEEESLTRG